MKCLQPTQCSILSGVNNVCLFVINYLSQRCHKLSKARCSNFIPAFWKLWKGAFMRTQMGDMATRWGWWINPQDTMLPWNIFNRFFGSNCNNIYIKYTNLPVNAIVRLPHPWSGDSQGQETFLAPSADK